MKAAGGGSRTQVLTGVAGNEASGTSRGPGHVKVSSDAADSCFSTVLRMEEAGSRKVGAGVFYHFSKKFGLERKVENGSGRTQRSDFLPH